MPARTAPAKRSGGPTSSSTGRFQRQSTTSTKANEAALSANTSHGPAAAMSRPPTAGPMARPRLMLAPPSVTACLSSCAGTSSGWIACQAGKLNAAPSPSAKVSVRSSPGVTASSAESTARPPAATSMKPWVISSRRRRSTRSAAAPASTPTTTTGR